MEEVLGILSWDYRDVVENKSVFTKHIRAQKSQKVGWFWKPPKRVMIEIEIKYPVLRMTDEEEGGNTETEGEEWIGTEEDDEDENEEGLEEWEEESDAPADSDKDEAY